MAVGNTFGATALSSYGGFWISFAIILTPGGFEIEETLIKSGAWNFYDSFGLYLIVRPHPPFSLPSPPHHPLPPFKILPAHSPTTPTTNALFSQGWFIFTFLLVLCTLKSTVAFFTLFFSLDMAFMLLGIGYLHRNDMGKPNEPIIKAGGFFALLAAFMAWYNALAGIADDSNSFFVVPVMHFPWSATGLKKRGKMPKGEKEV